MHGVAHARFSAALALGAVLLCAACPPAGAQELYALWGGQHTQNPNESTYSYSYEYLQNLSEDFVASYTYLNEGHVTNHHRDGHSVQLWYRWLTPQRRFALLAGIGPYRFYDTTELPGATSSTDLHGWGVMGSAIANWYFHYPWVVQLRYNYTYTSSSITTSTYQLGIGYQFDPAARPGPVVPAASYGFDGAGQNELTAMIGQNVVNNFQSPRGAAWAIEYRYRLSPFVAFSGAVLDEGDSGPVRRKGVTAEAWLTRDFLDHRGEVGIGIGPYLALSDYHGSGSQTNVLGLLTVTMAYRFSRDWRARFYWYRTVTNTGTDTDCILIGVAYAF
jgi:hypothetical protein